jgi:Haem-binding domain
MKKFLRPALIALLGIFVVIQFIRPAPNNSGDESKGIATKYPVPADVQTLLKTACNDCHSNSTVYPWYAGIQPVAWWLDDHIRDGKRHLNFSTFTSLPIAVQNHKFEEVIEQVKEGEMPLSSYTLIHSDAVLSEAQRALLTEWAQANMDSLKATYPPDSLVMKRRSPPGGAPPQR